MIKKISHKTGINWIMFIYFGSGLCSLIDEVVWVRLVKLTLGNTVYASSIVVSVFMGGLTLGALIMARHADKIVNRLKLYAILEVLVTISALLLPLVLKLADIIYKWVFVQFQPSTGALMVVQVFLSALILLVPSMLMGSTLPLLGRYITSLKEQVGNLVGRLYALNMLGAVLGCFLAGFVLIRITGVMGTLYFAAFINLLVALGGWLLSRFETDNIEEADIVSIEEGVESYGSSDLKPRFLMLAFFISGLVSIGYEIIWMRGIVFLMGGFTYVFASVLMIYLLGNVFGVWIGTTLVKRIRQHTIALGICLTCLGIIGIVQIPWINLWSFSISQYILPIFGFVKSPTSQWQVISWAVINNFFLFIIPSIIMGIGFPLALQCWSKYKKGVGITTGTVYGINTIGAVIGGIIAGFILIPLLGVQHSIMVLGLFGVVTGGILIQNFAESGGMKRVVWYLAAASVIAMIVIPSKMFEEKIISLPGSEVLYVKEGITTTITVEKDQMGHKEIKTDGVRVGGEGIQRSAQQTLGFLGSLLNKNSKDVLSIGFGTGETTNCVSQIVQNKIDCVEISPEVVEAALKYFSEINLGKDVDKKLNIMFMDGKNYLHLTDKKYDVIINGANVATYPGSAPMFAREHFTNAREHLNPGGLFITKLQLADTDWTNIDSVLGTFLDVFPSVTLWYPTTKPYVFFYLAGSRDKQTFSPEFIRDKLKQDNIRKSFSYLNFTNMFDLFNCYIGDEKDIRNYLTSYEVNSDYTPYVEFNNISGPELRRSGFFPKFFDKVRRNSLVDHIDWGKMTTGEQDRWLLEYKKSFEVSTYMLSAYYEIDIIQRLLNCYMGLKLSPNYPALVEMEYENLSFMNRVLHKQPVNRLLAYLDTILAKYPDFGAAWLIKSWISMMKKDLNGAVSEGEKAVKYTPHSAKAQENLGALNMQMKKIDRAVQYFENAVKIKPDEARLQFNLGLAYSFKGRVDNAIQHIKKVLEIRPDDVEALCLLGDLLNQKGKKEEAMMQYQKALSINPSYVHALKRIDKNKEPAPK